MPYSAYIIHGIAVDDKNSCYNIRMLEQKVKETILKRGLLQKGDRVVVGISGGPDSVCLLHVLCSLAGSMDLRIFAVHVHHGLRGHEADADRDFTESFCAELGVPCRVFSYDVAGLAGEEGLTTEEMGRILRYRSFDLVREELLREPDGKYPDFAVRIAVAQNRNDQAETLLMRLLRGTGADGLAGMEYLRDDRIIRPLLDISRDAIEAYCREKNLSPRIDLTNLMPDYTRNKIRLALIPYLQKEFNENILEGLSRLARNASEDKVFLYQCVEEAICRVVMPPKEDRGFFGQKRNRVTLDRKEYRTLAPAISKRLLLKVTKDMGLLQDMAAVHLEEADRLIRAGAAGARLDLPHGYRLMISGDAAAVSFENCRTALSLGAAHASEEGYCHEVNWDELTEIPEANACLRVTVIPADGAGTLIPTENGRKAFLSADPALWEGPVCIRTRRPGDWIMPLGMTGSKTLQDYFVDQKIPRDLRASIPLLCCGQEILWIVGGRISEKYKVKRDAEKMVSLEYIYCT